MGTAADSSAVVTNTGKVIGVQNLRVVDASTFPLLPPGHLLATVCKFELAIALGRIFWLTTLRRACREIC